MKRILSIVAAVFMMGCASSPTPESAPGIQPPAADKASDAAPGDDKDSSSQVLMKNKKCPKHSKMVNGKCTLEVESDE